MTDASLIENFCILDEFCKYFAPELKRHTLDTSGKRRRNRRCMMSDSEIMSIPSLLHPPSLNIDIIDKNRLIAL